MSEIILNLLSYPFLYDFYIMKHRGVHRTVFSPHIFPLVDSIIGTPPRCCFGLRILIELKKGSADRRQLKCCVILVSETTISVQNAFQEHYLKVHS